MYNIHEKNNNQYYKNNPKFFDKLIELCQKDKIKQIHQYLKFTYKDLLLWIDHCVPQLANQNYQLSTKINWILNNRNEFPKCKNKNCKKPIIKNIKINKEYSDFCCQKCAASAEQTRQKNIQTSLKKYGVINGGGSRLAQLKMHKKYYYDNIYFDSMPEISFYIWLKDNNIQFEFHPNIQLKYFYKDKQYSCQPDFKVNDTLIELKGNHFLKNNGTWQNPFNHLEDERYEAKHQCLLENNVVIYYTNDYVKYLNYVILKYGKYYLQQFRVDKKEYVKHMKNIVIDCNNLKHNVYYKNNPSLFMQLKTLIENSPKSYVAKLNGIFNQRGKQKKQLEYINLVKWINSSLPLLTSPIYKMNTKCYWIMYGLIDFPTCPICNTNNKYKLKNIRSFQDGYKQFCSVSCGTKFANLYTKQNKFKMV